MSIIPKFIFSRRYEGIYCKTTILGICITTKPKYVNKIHINKQIENEFQIIRSDNYVEKSKKLALLFCFGIGDYLLFRLFLPYIRDYYKDYNITLIVAVHSGNYKDIILSFDMQYIDDIIIFPYFTNNFNEKFEIFFSNRKYDILISHFYNRGAPLNYMVSKLNANIKIGSFGSLWHESRYVRSLTLQYYNKIICNNIDEDEIIHELDRNKNFFEQLFNQKIEINSIDIKLKDEYFTKIDFSFNNKYCILFPFSGDIGRCYDIKYFSLIANHLYSKYNIISLIVGSNNDIDNANKIINNKNEGYIKNICGKYKLNELFYIFNKAKLIISIDSAGYHIGLATNKNVICISSGMSYHRYLKYNDNYINDKNINVIFPKQLEEDIQNNKIKLDYEYFNSYDVNSIEPDFICNIIDKKYNLN
ncbi:glycosyltransferase family 9 protein [Brachyspira pilosicoli]|uniref:Lipopolysaccharide heptosyltransferase family protein n=1 Tax=Brachyspira pilosicoli TaxID=52584 RepID=A0AAJ6KET7_BRAPL|nr:glycosyltransferase family 9 protein [Brachyspira pilosicoli]WIH82423.1 lipopolysaccharide heptosyltransferase family protein [Brachyspira pilosicoli]WIH86911.1 lipopolysaccharide heptosyltransferase family protein [Brachyspira pilosicoli]WIH91410.1 lipopolysaccharide heptosyltransferase family protein [Brachyspira pilosicoli]WIH93701.1 lipopolysaccharide heptosyltransferase family protein [Brachyspira pilosicoli]WIH95989.1 lipopolysaccharide heptosyltransferase family protein [Brachyspira 